jgi:opacity protein-like surface antigen
MKKIAIVVVLALFMVSCKSKAIAVVASNAPTTEASNMTSKKIIENYYNNKNQFSTLYIKSSARYADNKQTQNVTAEIRIKKDEQILVSIRFLGITMAKALITPKSVNYYEKINGSYFEGDFSSLSQWLGTDLDYNKIQNMLLGQAIDDLTKGKYLESLLEQTYRLDDTSNANTKKSFFLDADKFLVQKQEITQTAEERMIKVAYADNKVYNEATLPTSVLINTFQKKGNTEINLDYNTVTFNEELSFPYSVPNGYKRIIIK